MRPRLVVYVALLAAAYVALARLGLALDAVSGFAALVWPPTGLALACLLRGGTALWPGVLVGAVTANLWAGAPAPAALGIGLGNTLEAVAALAALRRFGFEPGLERVRDVVLLASVALISPLLSAGIGVFSLHLTGVVGPGQAAAAFRAWWIGDALGALVVAPLLLAFSRRGPTLTARRVGETVALAGFTALTTWFVFGRGLEARAPFQQPFLIFPALVWAALRLGQRTAITTTFLVSAAAIAATASRMGPFVQVTLHEGLLAQQVFMGVVSVGVLLLGAAVAERSRVQEALRDAVAARDEFLSIAGHELRTPLAALALGLAGLHRRLQQTPETPPPGTLEGLAGRAQRSLGQVERLNQLVDRLLSVSQLQQGGLRLERQQVDLRTPVNEVVQRFSEQAEQAGCRIALSAGQAVSGYWDPLGIEQVATNLIANAIKYGAGKPIEVSVHQAGDDARLTVRDQGIGVPPDDLERIFDRFARAVSTRHFGGLGLGLYIARRITEAHGGTIDVTSQPGVGSSFVVHLPRAPASEARDVA